MQINLCDRQRIGEQALHRLEANTEKPSITTNTYTKPTDEVLIYARRNFSSDEGSKACVQDGCAIASTRSQSKTSQGRRMLPFSARQMHGPTRPVSARQGTPLLPPSRAGCWHRGR